MNTGPSAPETVRPVQVAVLIALIAAVYLIALPGPFQFDDYATIAVDRGAQSPAAWWANADRHVRPLTKASFVLTHLLGEWIGNIPMTHRIANLATHLAAMLALTVLGARVARTCLSDNAAQAAGSIAFVAAAIFGLHPFATEAVSYLSGRSMALGTLLAAASLWAYLRWRCGDGTAWGAAALVACLGALLARETAFVTPLLWLGWEWARRDQAPAPPVASSGPLASAAFTGARLAALTRRAVLPVAIVALFGAWLMAHQRYGPLLEVSRRIASQHLGQASFLPAIEYFASGFALLRYPNIDPDLAPGAMSTGHRWLASFVLAGIVALAWRARRTRPHWLIGLLWVLAWLGPMYALRVRYDAIAERHFHPALWGAAFPLAVEMVLFASRGRTTRLLTGVVGAFAALALSTVTLVRNADYRSEIALWEAARRGAPDKVRVLNNLGVAYMEAKRWDDAHAVLERAVVLDPDDEQVRFNLLQSRQRDRGGVIWPQPREHATPNEMAGETGDRAGPDP